MRANTPFCKLDETQEPPNGYHENTGCMLGCASYSYPVGIYTRGDQKVRGKKLPFLHRLINRAGITALNTATHMQMIGYNMRDVSRLRALQLSSRQRYIARSGPFYVSV